MRVFSSTSEMGVIGEMDLSPMLDFGGQMPIPILGIYQRKAPLL